MTSDVKNCGSALCGQRQTHRLSPEEIKSTLDPCASSSCSGFLPRLSPALQAQEIILLSGGPAVRSFEKFKINSHDKYWGNFIDSALQRAKDLQAEAKTTDKIVWLVFRPSYLSRGREDNQDYLKIIEERGKLVGVSPIYFDNKNQLLTLLRRDGSKDKPKISRLEYFGHSNKKCWMFD